MFGQLFVLGEVLYIIVCLAAPLGMTNWIPVAKSASCQDNQKDLQKLPNVS